MLRKISMTLVLAALATSGSALSARSGEQGKPATPAAGKPAAPPQGKAPGAKPAAAPVTPADVAPLMGTWEIPLETPTGRLVASLVFRTEAGKVVAGISAPQFPEHKITDITKAGQVVTLKSSTNYSGPLTAFSGGPGSVVGLQQLGISDRRHGQEEGLVAATSRSIGLPDRAPV